MVDGSEDTASVTNDTSGFVEHLRLVHLTLCLTCFIAIIAIASQTVSSASRAYDQTNFLLKLRDGWRNGRWLDDLAAGHRMAEARIEAFINLQGGPSQTVVYRSTPDASSGMSPDRVGWFTFAVKRTNGFATLQPSPIGPFDTAANAETVWNALNELRYAVKPSSIQDGWMIKFDGSGGQEAKLVRGRAILVPKLDDKPQEGPVARWSLRSEVSKHLSEVPEAYRDTVQKLIASRPADSYFIASADFRSKEVNTDPFGEVLPGPDRVFLFPVDCTIETVNLQELLSKSIISADLPPGDFARAFPDVSELARSLRSLSLVELQSFFQSEKDRVGDKIEFPMIKLPAESVAYWGTATIFALTLYWFAVFRDFSLRVSPADKAWGIAWIGISREVWSKSLFLATAFIPPCTAAFIIFRGVGRPIPWSGRVALMVAVFLAIGLPAWGIVSSWRRVQRTGRVAS
jgi:hypothetical protein